MQTILAVAAALALAALLAERWRLRRALRGCEERLRSLSDTEERLRESEADFRRLVQLSPVALAVTDRRSAVMLVNDQFVTAFGYTREELPVVESWWPLAYPDEAYRAWVRSTWERSVAESRAAGRPVPPHEYRVTCKDGSVRDVVFRLNFLANKTIYSLEDVTEFRRAEANFRDMVLLSRPAGRHRRRHGRVVMMNDQFVAAFGYAAGRGPGALVPTCALPRRGSPAAGARRTGGRSPPGRGPARSRTLAAAGAAGHPQGRQVRDVVFRARLFAGQVIFTLQDVTEERRARAELARHRDRLEELVAERTAELQREIADRRRAEEAAQSADRLKSAFLATMSHELRTPLNSILGFTGLLLKGTPGPLNDEQRKQLAMVQTSSRHLLTLINDVLDLSKIEAGQMPLRAEPFDLAGLIRRAVRAVGPLAQKKGLALTAEAGDGVGPVLADSRRVEQVLLNLLSNAIKFTERGGVSVHCEARGAWAVTVVRDTGIGIAAEDLAGLFRPFHQIDIGLSRKHEGTGLGLTICRRLVNMMGGAIRVVSELGRGSAFIFTLPLAQGTEP
ncbi:MAG: ATP-binding protein [Gemmataceae bacterium]